jgi:hypothetical protein
MEKKKKKKGREEKKCKERREFTFKLCPLTFGFHFWPHVSTFSFRAFSPWHLLLFKQKKRKKNTPKKNIKKKIMQRKEGTYLSSLASAFG